MARAKSLIEDSWTTLEVGQHGYERVIHVRADIALNPQQSEYDDQLIVALVEECKPFLEKGLCERVTVHGKSLKADDAARA